MIIDNIKRLKEEIADQRQIIEKIDKDCNNETRSRKPEEKKAWQEAKEKIKELSEELRDFEEEEQEKMKRAKPLGYSNPTTTYQDKDVKFIYSTRKEEKESKNTLGKILRLAHTQKPKNQQEELLLRDLSTTSDSEGGYITPSYTSNEMFDALTNYSSVIQAGAEVVDLSQFAAGDEFKYAKVATLPTTSYYSQNSQISESDPVLGEVKFTPKKGAFLFEVPNELIQDGLNTDQKLEQICMQAAGEEIDRVALVGSGASNEPAGIVNASGINTTDFGTTAGAAPADFTEMINAKYEIMNAKGSVDNLSVIHSPRTMRDYAKLVTGNSEGQPLQKPDFIADIREFASQAIAVNLAVGSGTGSLSESIMGDFKDLAIGLRLRPTIFVDPYRKSDYDQVVFRVTFRLDVQPIHPESFCLMRYIAAAS